VILLDKCICEECKYAQNLLTIIILCNNRNMVSTDTIIELAKLGLDNDKTRLVQYIQSLAVESSNKNKQKLSKELKNLLNSYSGSKAEFSSSSFEEGLPQNQSITPPLELWLSETLNKRIERFIAVHTNETLPLDLKQAYSRILLYGPPGSGKTTLGYYIAAKLGLPIVYIKVSDVISSRFGETTRNIADIFAQPGRQLIFLDEFDAFGKSRYDNNDVGELKRIVNSLIQTLDFAAHEKIVLGATNIIESIDPAIVRRFNLKIKIDKLDKQEILQFLDFLIKGHSDISIRLTGKDKKEIVSVFFALGISTLDSIKNVFEHTVINTHLAKKPTIELSDVYGTLLTSGYLEKASMQKLSTKDKAIYKTLMSSLSEKFNNIDISSYAGVHRNSIGNYNRKTSENA